MPLGFRPVPIEKNIVNQVAVQAALQAAMRAFGAEAQNELSTYPPDSGFPRTGELGRRWSGGESPKLEGTDLVVRIVNNAKDSQGGFYGLAVQGPRGIQQQKFADYGWKNVTDVREEVWDGKHRPLLAAILRGQI